VKLAEPGADLGLCLALVSAVVNKPLPADLVVVGEVGLAGEVRQVAQVGRRLAEASRLGFTRAIVPQSASAKVQGMRVDGCATINEALSLAGLSGAFAD
jgi:DNA repair protein RadA/Sms